MAEEHLEWVFDSLVEFLRGPIWNIPVLTFIEQKSVVFEPGAENVEELKKIHEAYKNLVDFMIGSYMEDLKITPEEFEKSCSVASKKALNQFHQNLFQQVWAADDFEIFRRMMTQKNLELQLQALEVLTQKHGFLPQCMETANDSKGLSDEVAIMQEVIKKALEEQSEETNSPESQLAKPDIALEEKSRLQAECEKEEELLNQAMKLTIQENIHADDLMPSKLPENEEKESKNEENNKIIVNEHSSSPLPKDIMEGLEEGPPVNDQIEKTNTTPESQDISQETTSLPKPNEETVNAPNESQEKISGSPKIVEKRPWSEGDQDIYSRPQIEVSPIEMERRQNYLKQQRDRLLALKRQERNKHFSNQEQSEAVQERPKSARAARKVLRQETTEIDPQTLAFRKSLAAKLRSEVIDKA